MTGLLGHKVLYPPLAVHHTQPVKCASENVCHHRNGIHTKELE